MLILGIDPGVKGALAIKEFMRGVGRDGSETW